MPKQQSQKKQTQLLVLLLVMFACVTAYSATRRTSFSGATAIGGPYV